MLLFAECFIQVPFFSDNEGLSPAAKGGAVFFRRENPRALVVLPAKQWPQRFDTEKMSQLVHASLHVYKNGECIFSEAQESNNVLCHICILEYHTSYFCFLFPIYCILVFGKTTTAPSSNFSKEYFCSGTISAEVSAPALVNGSLCQYEDGTH